MSSAVGRLFWFQTDGPGVRGHNVSPSMDAAGVNPLVELVSDDAEVSVLHDDVARDGRQDLLAVLIPAEGDTEEMEETGLYLGPGFVCLGHVLTGPFCFYPHSFISLFHSVQFNLLLLPARTLFRRVSP